MFIPVPQVPKSPNIRLQIVTILTLFYAT